MRQIILGDIHGRTIWKGILKKETFDRVIFIGDYVDTHEDITGLEQLANLQEICEYKRASKRQIILLIGNHDFQYWPGIENEIYSGYQAVMADAFRMAFIDNEELFQMCFVDEHATAYTHAGLTETFIGMRIGNFSQEVVNSVFEYKPWSFGFYPMDRSGCGDDIHQSCIWVRPQSLYRDGIDNLQVVGHTSVNKINHPAKSERRGFYMIDALAHGEYLSCTDGEFKIEKYEKEKD